MGEPVKDAFEEAEPADGAASGTRLESVEEIRQALAQARRSATVQEAGAGADTLPFRPSLRPPMALLCVLDDGGEEGEWHRIRTDKVVIGRTEGEVLVPHDPLMSARHAELARHAVAGGWRWRLTDLKSTNGVYVRVASALLKPGQDFLVGSRRFRFRAPQAALPALPVGESQPTRGWQSMAPADLLPALVEITPQGDGQSFLLSASDHWIGRDPGQCTVALPDDLMVSPRHARLYKDAKGRWCLKNAGSRNGTWVRIDRMPLDGMGQFQLGEQRFLIRIVK